MKLLLLALAVALACEPPALVALRVRRRVEETVTPTAASGIRG